MMLFVGWRLEEGHKSNSCDMRFVHFHRLSRSCSANLFVIGSRARDPQQAVSSPSTRARVTLALTRAARTSSSAANCSPSFSATEKLFEPPATVEMKYGTNSPTVYQQVGQADIPPSQTEGHRALLPCSRRLLHLYGRTAVRWSHADSLVTIAEMIRSGFSTESALHRFLQTVNRATDCLVHGRFMMGHSDGFTAIAARFDHAALVVVTGFVASRLAKVHIELVGCGCRTGPAQLARQFSPLPKAARCPEYCHPF